MMNDNKFHVGIRIFGKKAESETDYTLVKNQMCIYFHEFRMPS